jgi:hypothetical protein
LYINIITETKKEYLKKSEKDNIYHINTRFNNYYDFTYRYDDLSKFVTQLQIKGGYLDKNYKNKITT